MSNTELHSFEAAIESIKAETQNQKERAFHAFYLFELHQGGCATCQAIGKLCPIGQKISDFYDTTKGGEDAE